MNVPFRTYHLRAFFDGWDGQIPLDLALYHYFKERRALGSKDRKAVTTAVYDIVKWKRLIDFPEENLMMDDRIDEYLHGHFRERKDVPGAVRVSLPDFLWDRLVKAYGEEKAFKIGEILNTRAPLTLRVNTLKTTRDTLLENLKNKIDVAPTSRSPWGIHVLEGAKVRQLPEHEKGLFEIQDEGSQLLSQEIAIKPGELFLDYCAGSGGKSLAVAMQMKGKGQLFLHDVRKKSLTEAKERLARAGIQNYQMLNNKHKKGIDWVLVDAPCSGTGTLRRSPEMKWKLTEDSIARFVQLQREVIAEALPFCKPNGHFVYATCSLLQEENEEQVEYILAHYPVKLVSTLKILPEENGPDGFFSAHFTVLPSNGS